MTASGAITGIPMSMLQLGIGVGAGAQGGHMWEDEHQGVLWFLGDHREAHRCNLSVWECVGGRL